MIAGKPATGTVAPYLLQNLEDRLLYDVSPLAGLISPLGESVEILESLDLQLTDLMNTAIQEDVASPMFADQIAEVSIVVDFSHRAL